MSLPLLRSSVIPRPFSHGFTTREGGVSEGTYATLNVSAKWGDDPARVRENRRRLLREVGALRLYSVTQVHGAEVRTVPSAGADPEAIARERADALATSGAGIALAVYTA